MILHPYQQKFLDMITRLDPPMTVMLLPRNYGKSAFFRLVNLGRCIGKVALR